LSEEAVCNFLTKNNTAPAGSIADGITSANINSSKYLFIIENDTVDDAVILLMMTLMIAVLVSPNFGFLTLK
jgi:hypothetical protein